MKKLLIKKKIFIILPIIMCISIFLICNKSSVNVTLDEVKLKDSEVNKKQFAMYIRNSKDEKYQEYTDENNLFPVGYKLDLNESGCTDSNGNKIYDEGIISLSTDNKVTIKSNKTVYCYLYFEKNNFNGTGLELAQSNPDNLTKSPVADLYRYIGTAEQVTNNYICFGTTNKDDCISKDSNYLYRIIGIEENTGRLKIIINKAIDTSTGWHNNYADNAVWDVANSDKKEAELHKNLNSTTFLDSTTYVPNGWKDKIADTNWYIGDSSEGTLNNGSGSGKTDTGDNVWKWESASSTSTTSKIGLMYLSDYYYAYDGTGNLDCYTVDKKEYEMCKSSWLHISHNGDSSTTDTYEWTMTRYGYDSDFYHAWLIHLNGRSSWYGLANSYAIRPVFYLKASSIIKDGSGTSDDPYILESPEETGERLVQEKFNGEPPAGFKTTPSADLYRFVGKREESGSINNYVCFGASNCSSGEIDNHLYRIIGITASGNLKIQKNSSITPSQWHNKYSSSDCSSGQCTWDKSTMYTNTLKSFYDNGTYVSQDMKTKIDENHTWNTGDVQIHTDGDTIYNLEKQTKSSPGAVGLAYLSDYYYAYNELGTQDCRKGSYCKSWMVPSDYSSLWSNQDYEWTMTRYGKNSNVSYAYDAWIAIHDGDVSTSTLSNERAVRPVFYLTSDVTLTTNGDSSIPKGSIDNPWIVELN